MYGDPTTTPGGKALKFYSSIRLQVARASLLDVTNKNGDLEQRGIRVTVKKNKVDKNSLAMSKYIVAIR